MTTEPLPFDLKLARTAFATSAGLHGAATRRAADRLTDADFAALRAHDAAFTIALKEGRVSDAIAADDAFHRVILEASDDPDLVVSVALMVPRLRRMDLWLFTRKAFDDLGQSSHPAIIAALEADDGETAAALVEQSFTSAGEDLHAVVARGAAR